MKKEEEKEGERREINLHCSIYAHYTSPNTMDIHRAEVSTYSPNQYARLR